MTKQIFEVEVSFTDSLPFLVEVVEVVLADLIIRFRANSKATRSLAVG